MIATLSIHPHIGAYTHSFVKGVNQSIVLRRGTLSDLEAILHIGLAAMPMDPQWDYRFPYRRAFPQDQRDATRRRYREFLESELQYSVYIAETFGSHGPVPVAFAIWDISNLTQGSSRPSKAFTTKSTQSARRDASPKRMHAWKDTLREAKAQYFEHPHGADQIQLQILATHPDYQRLGAGTLLVDEGIRLADASALAISVFASPMGARLYSKLGFKSRASVVVRAEGEAEFVNVEAMVYEPKERACEPVKREEPRDRTLSGPPIWLSGTRMVCASTPEALPERVVGDALARVSTV